MSCATCWLCTHCDLEEVVEMMNFVEEKSPVMHVDMISEQVCDALKESFPAESDHFTSDLVSNHICRHVVTPVASVTRITRDLLDMCESLKPTFDGVRPGKRRRGVRAINAPAAVADEMEIAIAADECLTPTDVEESEMNSSAPDNTGLYLRTVSQVMGIYRMHHKLLTPASLLKGGNE